MKQLIALASILALSACSSDNDSNDADDVVIDPSYSYTVTMANLSNAQPISPPIAVLHEAGFSLWETGQSASVALEVMAEGGDATQLQTEAGSRVSDIATGALLSGTSDSLTLEAKPDHHYLTVAGMLVNTNDAFTGINAIDVSGLDVDQSHTVLAPIYDAGTEANSEDVNTIPGPAAGGEGFASERDDVTSVITYHPGVVTADDGYAESTLNQSHRFDSPVMKITITRIK